jgi:hypothetical protein
MKIELDIDIEQYRLSLVGDGYIYEEVKDLKEEQLIEILQNRLTHSIAKSAKQTLDWGLIEL